MTALTVFLGCCVVASIVVYAALVLASRDDRMLDETKRRRK